MEYVIFASITAQHNVCQIWWQSAAVCASGFGIIFVWAEEVVGQSSRSLEHMTAIVWSVHKLQIEQEYDINFGTGHNIFCNMCSVCVYQLTVASAASAFASSRECVASIKS